MPVSVRSLAVDEQTMTCTINGHSFDLKYRPSVLTPSFYRAYEAFTTTPRPAGAIQAWWLSRVVTWWDLADDDGSPLPLTEDWLAGQDLINDRALWSIVRQITADREDPFDRPSERFGGTSEQDDQTSTSSLV